MQLIIHSKKKKRDFVFICGDDGGYVRLKMPDGEYAQICEKGAHTGVTLLATPKNFERICKKWYRDFMRLERSLTRNA